MPGRFLPAWHNGHPDPDVAPLAHNLDFGAPLTSTDLNSLITSWTFDDYGRKLQETRPDGTYTTWQYDYRASPPCWDVADLRFLVISNHYANGGTWINEGNVFYDGFERLRYDESYRELGVWTANVKGYDTLGRLTGEDNPGSDRNYREHKARIHGSRAFGQCPTHPHERTRVRSNHR